MEALSRQWYPIVKAADMKAETPSLLTRFPELGTQRQTSNTLICDRFIESTQDMDG